MKKNSRSNFMLEMIEKQQRTFVISMNELNTIQCPKCKLYFAKESGDLINNNNNNSNNNNNNNKNSKGKQKKKNNNSKKEESKEETVHKLHESNWRFRCSECNTVFCGKCHKIPYHKNYTCDEFKKYQESQKCRYCDTPLTTENSGECDSPIVCNNDECMSKYDESCHKILYCGHPCIGIKQEKECPNCIHKDCVKQRMQESKNERKDNNNHNKQHKANAKKIEMIDNDTNSEDYCNICWVDPLYSAPCIRLDCGHYFHFDCIRNKLSKGYPSARITFNFLNCPLCKQEMSHIALNEITKEHISLRSKIIKDGKERLKIEGLDKDKRLADKNSVYYNNLDRFALDRLAFYKCNECNNPYFGGMKSCDQVNNENEMKYDKSQLVCGGCASGDDRNSCRTHGTTYISYKCKFCCNQAVWFCFGTTHYCEPCHQRAYEVKAKPVSELPKCPGKDKCPLKMEHPPNGTAEFSLGCVVCLIIIILALIF